MTEQSIEDAHAALERPAARCEEELRVILRGLLGQLSARQLIRARLTESRVKSLSSFKTKALRHGWSGSEAVSNITDMVGFRIVCNNLEDIGRIRDLVLSSSRLRPSSDPIQDFITNPQPSGYRALHLNLIYEVTGPVPVQIACEIQIRTLAQDMSAQLTHYDLYKQGESVPAHIVNSSRRLASLLSVADEIAQDIREQVSEPLVGVEEPGDENITLESLAFIYTRAFEGPSADYLVRTALKTCQDAGCQRFDILDRTLRDVHKRQRVAEVYEGITGWRLFDETWFELAPYVAVDEDDGLRRTAERAKAEWDEIDAIARHEILSDLPDTLEQFIQTLGDEAFIYQLADVFEAQGRCSICDCPIVRVDALVENILDHYRVDEDPDGELDATITQSGVEIGDWHDPSLCSYHGDIMSRDD